MTLKEFFTAVSEKFENNVLINKRELLAWRTDGICHAICRVADDMGLAYSDTIVVEADRFLKTYRPEGADAYWFPTRRHYSDQETLAPRRAILKRILADLEKAEAIQLEKKQPALTLKKFFELALIAFENDAEMRKSNSGYAGWTDGMCLALSAVYNSTLRQDNIQEHCGLTVDELRELYYRARRTLDAYKPVNARAYWWPIYKDNSTQEEALLPRRAVLNRIISLL